MSLEESADDDPLDAPKRERALMAVLAEIQPTPDIPASEFMLTAWRHYERYRSTLASSEGKQVRDYGSLNGSVFQSLIERVLLAHGVHPIYSQAEMAFISVAVYDIIIYTAERGPINLSLKTTIRERWKQADLEGSALKNVHKRARVYLVNNSPAETVVRTADLHNCIGIDGFVVCTAPEFDDLIREIRGWKPIAAPVTPLVRRATNTLEE